MMKRAMLAYHDSFAGLVPIRIDAIVRTAAGLQVDYTVTARCGAYHRGDKATVPLRHIVPRSAVKRSSPGRIAAYDWHKVPGFLTLLEAGERKAR